jgi:uncharacterized protein (DUF697 family)
MAQKPQSPNSEKDETITPANSTSVNEANTVKKPESTSKRRDALATHLVVRYALWSGAAGVIPVPGVDALSVWAVQVQMLRRLTQIYGVPFRENVGKTLIASLAGAIIPLSSAFGAASALKFVPIVGTAVSAFAMPALSAGATYAIGKAFIQHFESGGTLLDFNPPDYREFVKAQKEKWGSRSKVSDAPKPDSPGTPDTITGTSATAS